jgi:hypothetical protein
LFAYAGMIGTSSFKPAVGNVEKHSVEVPLACCAGRYVAELVVQFQETPSTMSRTKLFSRQAWDKNASIYEVIRTMPFNAQLALSPSRKT